MPRPTRPRLRGVLATTLALAAFAAQPPVAHALRPDPTRFPVPAQLEANVRFWTDIYAKYTSHEVVVHDDWYLDVVYTVLDFTEVDTTSASEAARRRARQQAVDGARAHYAALLDELARGETSAAGAVERAEVERKLARVPGGREKYRAARERLRDQQGLRNRFAEAVRRSGRWMGEIERVFAARGLPVELARLPFVESMFQGHARSKVGAAGIWQFMPSTGRLYMRVTNDVDERLDPLLAAEGAARLLGDNYRRLGTWPLALTAYNHGPAGMARAVSQVGSRDLGEIVERYEGPAFKFASRNFYAEFVAAALVYENRRFYFPGVEPDAPVHFDEFVPERSASLPTLARRTRVDRETLASLNPALSRRVLSGAVAVPGDYRLRVPLGTGASWERTWAELRESGSSVTVAAATERERAVHRVRKGETLSGIARRYGTTVAALRQANGMSARSTLRAGQRLDVPGREGPDAPPEATTRTVVVAAAEPDRAEAARPAEGAVRTAKPTPREADAPAARYVVRRGDTLAAIARTHGTTIAALQDANGIRRPSDLRAGRALVIPAGGSGPADGGDRLVAAAASERTTAKPPPGRHVVARGDTLTSIAKRYGTDVPSLRRLNGLGASASLRPGQTLRLSDGAPTRVAKRGSATRDRAAPKQHVVRKGETLHDIAERYGTTVVALRAANMLAGSLIRPNQSLVVP